VISPWIVAIGALLATSGAPTGDEAPGPSERAALKAEMRALKKQLVGNPVQLRRDVARSRPAYFRENVSESPDGYLWVHRERGVAFEALEWVRVHSLDLDRDGWLHVELSAVEEVAARVSALREHQPVQRQGSPIWVSKLPTFWALVDLDTRLSGSPRAALATLLHVDGATPTDEDVQQCLARYPEHDETLSRSRCGLTARRRGSLSPPRPSPSGR
jgi:hypothetical protein